MDDNNTPQVSTQDYIDAIKEAKANGKAVSINFGSLPEGVVASAIQTQLHEGLPQEYQDAMSEAASRGKTVSLDFSQVQDNHSMSNTIMDATKRVVSSLTGDTSKFDQPVSSEETNPIKASLLKLAQPFEGMVGPSRLSASISAPGQAAGQNVTTSLNALSQNLNNGKAPSGLVKGVNSVIGQADAMALDPQNYAADMFARGALGLGEKAVAKAGEEAAAGASALSGVKLRDIQKLFTNPMDVITALSKEEAGGLMGAAKKAAGVTREEEFLISKAGDRALGGARSVAEDLRPVFEATPANLTIGQLVALRRAAGKLATEAKGSETALWAPIAKAVTAQIEERAGAVAKGIEQYANAATKESFMRLIPRGKTGSPDFFRTIAALGSGLATSPAAVGLGTLATKAATSVVSPIASVATSVVPRNAGLAVLRKYLTQQQQHGPR